MTAQMIKLLVAVCAIVGAAVVGAQPVAPSAASNLSRAQLGQVPKISDTLTVAKSPFEPVTLAVNNLNSPESSRDIDVLTGDELALTVDIKKTTRAIQEDNDQTQKPMANGEQPSSSTVELTTTTPTSAEADVTTTGVDVEVETTTTPKSVDLQRSEEKTTTTTTTSSPATESTSSSSSESASDSSNGESNNNDSATTTVPELNLTPESSPETSSEKPATSTSTTETPQTEATRTGAPVSESSEEETSTSTSTSTTTPAPTTTTTSTSTSTSISTTTITTTTTTDAASSSSEPAAAEEPTSPPAATTTTTTTVTPTSTSTTTLKPQDQRVGNKTENGEEANGEEVKSSQACNHLPSYETDELQRVFREETTYKNGTIKGKFTYINFDQRYRLVHYTRLPYGPVKIDLVEELGRPESSNQSNRNNQAQLTPMSAIPNAVLQLRNILPNSLFGFPFLGPQTGSGSSNGIGRQQPGAVENDDKSNTYFYTTDTISTPNLLSPSVPVSLPPTGAGQRRIAPQQPSLDSEGPRNSIAGDNGRQQNSNDVLAALHKYRQQERANGEAMAHMFGVPNHQQFQYAVSQPQGVQSPDPKQPGLIYSYLAQPQYQYSAQPPPLYSFQQPAAYYPPSPRQVQASSYAINVNHGHHHHQPHSHEHSVTPFMFAQPPAAPGAEQQADSAKVKLVKVKTSKALNVDAQQEPIGKSAQMRSNPSSNQGIYSAPANSPAHVGRRQHQFRHRHGKQNPDLKQTVNTTPVVYHVLRSPMGRMYNLPQYQQQAYAVAYDHDN